jgi:hypothetical protein
MSLPIVGDMNLSVEWIPLLEQAGWSAVHWSAIGDPRADDAAIMAWASAHGHAAVGCVLARTNSSLAPTMMMRASTHPTQLD